MLFASDGRNASSCAWLACSIGLLNNAHEIAMSCVLDRWTPEVLHVIHALRQQRLRRPFGFVATPPTVCEWAPTGLGRSARFVFLATNVAYFAAAWSLQGWPRLGVGALAAVSTIFHSVQTGCWLPPRTDLDAPPQSVRHRPRERRRRRRGYNQVNRRPLARAGGRGGPLRRGDRVPETPPLQSLPRHARPLASSQCCRC